MLNKQGCELQQDGPLGLSIDFTFESLCQQYGTLKAYFYKSGKYLQQTLKILTILVQNNEIFSLFHIISLLYYYDTSTLIRGENLSSCSCKFRDIKQRPRN